jgi:hypothetical protein
MTFPCWYITIIGTQFNGWILFNSVGGIIHLTAFIRHCILNFILTLDYIHYFPIVCVYKPILNIFMDETFTMFSLVP